MFIGTLLLDNITILKLSGFNVFLGIVPSTTSVGAGNSHLDTGNEGTGQETSNGSGTEDETNKEGSDNDQSTGTNHFSQGSLGGDGDTSFVVRVNFTSSDLGVISELSSDFEDHLKSSLSDRLHGHGRESVGQHSTDQETREQKSISDLDVSDDKSIRGRDIVRSSLGSGDEGTIKSHRDESSGSDSETLTNSSSGVTSSIKSISSVSGFLTKFSHFGNTTSIIRDGTISIDSQTDGKIGEHTKSSKGNTEKTKSLVGDVSGNTEEDDGDNAGEVSQSKTVDDVGGSTSLAGFRDFLDGLVGVGGIVFSQDTDHQANNET
mmetsp:Transcript_24165/g.21217  ORF Transcript_24165/g.21217 Transcript_24165/m.21217 type:complete len:320 (+) Transcript_24165:362-1321(+)